MVSCALEIIICFILSVVLHVQFCASMFFKCRLFRGYLFYKAALESHKSSIDDS